MTWVLRDTVQTARKHYPCDACHLWLDAGLDQQDVSADEWLVVQGARADKWRITPGMHYRKVVYIDGGAWYTYRARLDMDHLCEQQNLFDD